MSVFDQYDLASLPDHEIYTRLMARGVMSQPFSARTTAPSALVGPVWCSMEACLAFAAAQR